MKKRAVNMYIAAAVLFAAGFAATGFAENSAGGRNVRFLEGYGIEVSGFALEKSDVNIPKPFDKVYENYNELQKEAGLDLLPYAGERAVRYTYKVLNYPEETDDEVRANVLCVDGKPVGGDVMTVALDGFIKPLSFMKQEKEE